MLNESHKIKLYKTFGTLFSKVIIVILSAHNLSIFVKFQNYFCWFLLSGIKGSKIEGDPEQSI